MTSKPSSAMQAAWVAPRYPVPMTLSRKATGLLRNGARVGARESRRKQGQAVLVRLIPSMVTRQPWLRLAHACIGRPGGADNLRLRSKTRAGGTIEAFALPAEYDELRASV